MSLRDFLKKSDSKFRRDLIFLLASYFLVLFSYPLIRASTTSIFFEVYGAKSSPQAWVWSILFLSLSIYLCNRLQKFVRVQLVFGVAGIFSGMVFLSGELSLFSDNKLFAYGAFVWKEICIVLQVHLILAYANNFLAGDNFKKLIGPIGAIGSLGGILGGVLTNYISNNYGTSSVLIVGVFFVILPALTFYFTPRTLSELHPRLQTPVASLKTPEIRWYVFFICSIVALTQFIINIADFKFNLAFEAAVPTSDLRTGQLGQIYAWTNALTFVFQFILLPFILPRVSEKRLHLFIPLSYVLALAAMAISSRVGGFFPIAALYIYFKAADYSFFSAAKELLYRPLETAQKYGAKYLTDMLVYRSAKALIALVLIYLQSPPILDMMMVSFLLIWLYLISRLFKLHQKLFF
jgi:ATP:ADP antiporter, AAA family